MALKRKSKTTEVEEELFRVIEKFGRDKLEGFLSSKLGMVRRNETYEIQNQDIKEKSPPVLSLYEAKELFLKDSDFLTLSPKTQETYLSELRVFLRHCGMPQKEDQVSCGIGFLDVIQPTFLGEYLDNYDNVNTKSKKSAFLRCFIRTVAEDEYQKREKKFRNVLKVEYVKESTPLAFTSEQQDELLSLVKIGRDGLRNYTITQTFLNSGLRVNELRNIQISDIDFECHKVMVILKRHTKKMPVRVTKKVIELLRTYIDFTYSYQKTVLSEQEYSQLYVFSANNGKNPVTSKTIQRFFQKSISKAKTIPETSKYDFDGDNKVKKHCYGPHSCRHTFSINLLESGVDIYTIKELLNHKTLASTEKYLRLFDHQLKAAVEKNPILDAAQMENLKKL